MQKTQQYQRELEMLIVKHLLPVYDKYYKLTGDPKPELDIVLLSIVKKRVPVLFKPKE